MRANRFDKMVSSMAVAVLTAASMASATELSFSGAKNGSVGNTQAGASYAINGTAYANDASSVNEAYVRLWGDATTYLLGLSGQLASLDGEVESKDNAGTLKVLVRACGFNVVNVNTNFSTGITRTYSTTYSATFLSTRATFWVSIVPVTFAGNVGGGASMNLTYIIGPLRAEIMGGPRAWGSTSASAGIGVAGYSIAAVGTTARLMNTYLRSTAGIGFLAGQRQGGVYLDITPLNANFWFRVFGFKRRNIAQWWSGSATYTLTTIQ